MDSLSLAFLNLLKFMDLAVILWPTVKIRGSLKKSFLYSNPVQNLELDAFNFNMKSRTLHPSAGGGIYYYTEDDITYNYQNIKMCNYISKFFKYLCERYLCIPRK